MTVAQIERRLKKVLKRQKASCDELLFCKHVSKESKEVLLDKFCREEV